LNTDQSSVCLTAGPNPPPSIPIRTLRVLTLTSFYPNAENVAEGCFVAEVFPRLQQLGIANHVFAVRPFYRGRVHPTDSEIPCQWKKYFSLPGNLGLPLAGSFLAIDLITRVQKIHRDRPFDLIHAHAALPCGHAAARLSKSLRIPFVVSVHGLDVFSERQTGRLLGGWCRCVSERVYRQARAVICISEKVSERIADASVNSRVIHNGVDASRFSPAEEQKSPLVVLSVGNLIPTKGHAGLLRAFARMLPSVPNCELEIIGEGPERTALACLSEELGISARVRFLGRQSRESLARAMQRCVVFALPSEYEGLGCVYLEAMASGKPAIACEGQGIDEIIEHGSNGWLVPPQGQAQLSDALRMLLQNQGFRSRLGNAARNTVLQRHTLEHQAEQLAQLYRECVL
jgi:teichuronic acid biosynthesis glycosyltransferase TuaC